MIGDQIFIPPPGLPLICFIATAWILSVSHSLSCVPGLPQSVIVALKMQAHLGMGCMLCILV